MRAEELRRSAKRTIDGLSGPGLALAAEFLSFVSERGKAVDAATAELLAIPGFRASMERGARDVSAGRVKSWREVAGGGGRVGPGAKGRGGKAGRHV